MKFTDTQVGITPLVKEIDLISPLNFSGLFAVGGGLDQDFNVGNHYQAADQISWTHGKHSLRAGGEVEHIRWPWVFPSISRGQLVFGTFPDFLLGLSACPLGTFPVSCNPGSTNGTTGTPFSNILATFLAVKTPPSGIIHGYRFNNANGFAQDDIKLNPRLTLNLGVRWEYNGHPTDVYGNLTNIWLSQLASVKTIGTSSATGSYAGFVAPANFRGELPPGILKNSNNSPTKDGAPRNNFAPRFGFAWQPTSSSRLALRGGYGFFYDRVNANAIIHAVEQSPPYSLTLDASGPALGYATLARPYLDQPLGWGDTRWVNFQTGASSNLNYPFMSEDFKTPLVQSYNLDIQYEFLPRWILEVGYAGSHGIHLVDSGRQVNTARLASPTNPVNGITTNTVANAALRVPYLGFAPAGLQQSGSDGDLKYNSLLVTLRKQFSHGFQVQGAYTYARAFTNQQANGSFYENLNSNDPNDSKQQYGISPFYRPQRFVLNYIWDLPFKSRGSIAGKLLGGWNLSGVTVIQDGTPLTVTDSRAGTIYCGACQAPFSNLSLRAQMAPGATYADVATPGSTKDRLGGRSGGPGYLNARAFGTAPTGGIYGDGTGFGNSGLGIVMGPGQLNFDVALVKTTRVGGLREDATLQFRSEFFNVFNHPQFGNPATDVSLTTFGSITSTTVNPRLIQFALKYSF